MFSISTQNGLLKKCARWDFKTPRKARYSKNNFVGHLVGIWMSNNNDNNIYNNNRSVTVNNNEFETGTVPVNNLFLSL